LGRPRQQRCCSCTYHLDPHQRRSGSGPAPKFLTSSPLCMLLVGPLLYTHSCTAVLTAHSCAQAEVDVGPVNAAGLRGTLAARDFAPGDTIIAVPFNLTVAVGGHNTVASVRTPPLCAGNCCRSTCFFACCARKAGCLAVQRSLWPARWAAAAPAAAGPLGRPGALLAQPAAGRHAVLQGAGAAAPRRRAAGRRAGAPAARARRAGLRAVLASRSAWVLMHASLIAGAALQL